METLRDIVAYQLEWVVMWETPGGYKKPIAAFLLKTDADLFVKNSELMDRMEVILNED